jgi:CheY-like chemotaxis protein
MPNEPHQHVEILAVEDNPADVRLIQEALKEGKFNNHLHIAEDGVEAVKYLHREHPYENAQQPDMILLDLNLPKMDGREVLARIKSDERLKNIPVIVLTTSKAEEDIMKSYNLHANCFITKPVGIEQFMKVVREIEDFWLSIVKLPPNHKQG